MASPLNQARAQLRRATRRLVRANVAHSWKGGGDPADEPGIDRELELAQAAWGRAVDRLEAQSRADALASVHMTLEGRA